MRHALRRLICLVLCLALSPAAWAADTETEAPLVRVYLKRLGLQNRADLVVDGVYTASAGDVEFRLPPGRTVVVQSLEDSLYLFVDSVVVRLGDRVTFTRYAGQGGAGGLRFSASGALYPGDLSLRLVSGALMPVLTLSVEDYLLGVVPYEMSDSFPLEALKAQAVCARTYALSHLKPQRDYDLVDTTDDQVFRGVSSANTASARAVRETRGLVGVYQGKLATCYYGASNGGQTELGRNVWPDRAAEAYYQMTDDPYDLENPSSPVKRVSLRKDAAGLPQALREAIYNALYDEMRRLGYDTEPTSLRLNGLSGLTLQTPAHAEPSRSYTELSLTAAWSARRWEVPGAVQEEAELSVTATATPSPAETAVPSPAPTACLSDYQGEEATQLTLSLFPDLVRGLDLSIYGGGNELLTLQTTDTGWTLESRRFGHGVGMSQRGAEWMARRYGMGFEEILAFYYPGMTLEERGGAERQLPSLPALLNTGATPMPSASPTPRPTLIPVSADSLPEGAYIASVENVADDSSLNLRSEPNTACEVIMRLYKHQPVIVLEVLEGGLWAHVQVGPLEGFVMLEFLK